MEKRLLSICIPTYNRNYELKRLYDNFLNPLAELSQCILDSSNGSIINVI